MDFLPRHLRFATFAVGFVGFVTGCQKLKTVATPERQIDACTLISKEEIQSIQGGPVKDVKSSVNTNGGFQTADCLYTSEIDNHSVRLAVVQRNSASPNARDPKEYWKTSFSRYVKEEGDADQEKQEEAEKSNVPPPKRIDGLGDGAFWATSVTGDGALYVLKGNAFIRINVAGSESEETRIDQSKALALKALTRF